MRVLGVLSTVQYDGMGLVDYVEGVGKEGIGGVYFGGRGVCSRDQ